MRMMKRLVAGAATTAMALAWMQAAQAQTTATQAGEVVVTGSRQPKTLDGVITAVQDAKDESIVSQAFLARQAPGENAAQLINLIPGVSFVSEDPTGISSGDLRIHGQTSDLVAITIDGAPVNDTGNYAAYPGEYLIAEATDHIEVNLGATDVDSPSAAATAGTINIVSKLPNVNPGVIAQYSAGSYNFQREYAEVDSGTFGPYGTRAYTSFNMQNSDKYRGSGTLPRIGTDGAIYQPLSFLSSDSFAKVSYTYDQERSDFYYSFNRNQLNTYGRNADYNQIWFQPTARNGVADGVPTQQQFGATDSNYYALHPNPVDFGQIRGQSYLNLTHGFHLTFDPYFFYTRANGGGTSSVSETDPRLVNKATGAGVDLNGDGDTKDTVLLYTPSNTQTHRYGVNTSLLWDPTVHDHFQLTYSLDYGMHRQTAAATPISGGQPANVFGGTDGYGPPILSADGTQLQNRNRYSIATLNQFAFNYIGKYFDNRLHVNLGVRDPFFVRHLNQYCYTYNGTSAYCNDVSPTAVQNLINAAQANNGANEAANVTALGKLLGVTPTYNKAANTVNLRTPFTERFSFNKPLPNVGATYRLFDHDLLYVTYAESFSAPKTDDLYTSSTELVKPQTADEYGVGWRHQDSTLITSLNYFYEIYRNRVLQSFDPVDPTTSIDRNIGKVDIYGIDAEAGKRLFDHLTLYGSASWNHSRVVGNEFGVLNGVTYQVPTDDKALVDTPEYTLAGRIQYDIGPASIGLQGKYTSYRYTTDINDDRTPGFAVWDLDARYNLNIFGYTGSYIQVNISNLFDRFYLGRISTAVNASGFQAAGVNGAQIAGPSATSGPYFYIGAPRYATVTLRAAF
jgi:iron complex outermembrane recepter protein